MNPYICATQVKAEVGCYLRFVRQHPLVAMEAFSQDILAVTPGRRILIVEVKISIADLKADWQKDWHYGIRDALGPAEMMAEPTRDDPEAWRLWGLARHARNYGLRIRHGQGRYTGDSWAPNEFWFAFPASLYVKASAVLDELYPYAGVLLCGDSEEKRHPYMGRGTRVERRAKELHPRKASIKFVSALVKAQSASLANAYTNLANRIYMGEKPVVSA